MTNPTIKCKLVTKLDAVWTFVWAILSLGLSIYLIRAYFTIPLDLRNEIVSYFFLTYVVMYSLSRTLIRILNFIYVCKHIGSMMNKKRWMRSLPGNWCVFAPLKILSILRSILAIYFVTYILNAYAHSHEIGCGIYSDLYYACAGIRIIAVISLTFVIKLIFA